MYAAKRWILKQTFPKRGTNEIRTCSSTLPTHLGKARRFPFHFSHLASRISSIFHLCNEVIVVAFLRVLVIRSLHTSTLI